MRKYSGGVTVSCVLRGTRCVCFRFRADLCLRRDRSCYKFCRGRGGAIIYRGNSDLFSGVGGRRVRVEKIASSKRFFTLLRPSRLDSSGRQEVKMRRRNGPVVIVLCWMLVPSSSPLRPGALFWACPQAREVIAETITQE